MVKANARKLANIPVIKTETLERNKMLTRINRLAVVSLTLATASLALLTGSSSAYATLAPGEKAPAFSAVNQDGKKIQLSDFKGQFVLIYFYPKDDTPGCTKQACNFRDQYSTLKKLNTTILGVSTQDEKSHLAFRAKHKLPFDLLVDQNGILANAYGVGKMPVIGLVKRQSILIGPDQTIVKFYSDVDPSQHVSEVMKDIKEATPK